MADLLTSLVDSLLLAKDFEDTATAVLEPMLCATEQALASSRYASQGRILRATVHVRPDDGYRDIALLERPAARAVAIGNEAGGPQLIHLPSASAWRWVSTHGTAIAIDLHLNCVELIGAGGGPIDAGRTSPSGQVLSRESVNRLRERASTHLFAVPLATPHGIVGMVSLEADCRAAMGRPFVWREVAPLLRNVAFIAAPHLLACRSSSSAIVNTDPLLPVVGASMHTIVKMGRIFAQQDETLLISGPTGVGKSRFARYCHTQSSRSTGPFEVLDLLSIPDDLQMGALIGWRKGAFSGADRDNPGALARAEGGTLFMDEIDKLTLKVQAGLLHVLEDRSYRPLGDGASERTADVRFVVGTNVNLLEAVKAGRFREDLYYRINVLPLRLPPLDERSDEIRGWAEYMFVRRHKEGRSDGFVDVSPTALIPLEKRSWPGNLRQLDNVIRRAYALALVDRDTNTRNVRIEKAHILRALDYEQQGDVVRPALPQALLEAARAYVHEAERLSEEGLTLDIKHANALKGLVRGYAAHKLGSLEAAFRLLGESASVEHRNHKKVYRREMECVAEFYNAAGGGQLPPFDTEVEDK